MPLDSPLKPQDGTRTIFNNVAKWPSQFFDTHYSTGTWHSSLILLALTTVTRTMATIDDDELDVVDDTYGH
jgi:hypothetical protein